MALDFPSSPTVGQAVTIGGVTWTWDGVKWTAAGTGAGVYLPLTGGTMTGDLILNRDPVVSLGAATKQSVDARGAGDNRLINGDMRIDARNSGASGTTNGYTVDRWRYVGSQASKVAWQQQSASGPPGFPYYFALSSTASYAVAASDYFEFLQTIEADMVSDFQWGSANAQPATLSFWVTSSQAGTFSGAVSNAANTRSYPFSFPSTGAWSKVVIPIPGDTAGAWTMSGNAGSIMLQFDLGSGANFRGPANAWASANYIGVTGAAGIISTSGRAFYVTGVKLEIGSVATAYPRQSLAKSMADCERYFRWIPFSMRFTFTGTTIFAQALTFSAMRAAPTISSPTADPNTTPLSASNSAATFDQITPYSATITLTSGTGSGSSYMLGYRGAASAEL